MARLQATIQILAKEIATEGGLNPALVCAVCERESSWLPSATRYEPAFEKWLRTRLRGFTDLEYKNRSTSWGLMQVMGEVAREQGFTEEFSKLLDPETALRQGVRHLKHYLDVAKGDVTAALQHYNGGGNPHYAESVLALKPKYQ